MAGRNTERTVSYVSDFVNSVDSTATKLISRARYGTDGNGNKVKLTEGKSEQVPYLYYQVKNVNSDKTLLRAMADLQDKAGLTAETIAANLNYGLEYLGRASLSEGDDLSITPKQRSGLKHLRGLVQDGFMEYGEAVNHLQRMGLNEQQVEKYFSDQAA